MLVCFTRVGEASNPGPDAHFDATFSLGAFNPSGLRNKSQYFSTHLSNGDIWMVSETHFFGKDVSKFRAGLKAAKARHRYCITDRTSLRPGLTSQTAWKGVATIASYPTRAMPSAMPKCLNDTGRALMTTTLVEDAWISGAVLYGEPDGHLYPNHIRNNEFLLHHVAAQVCHLTSGMRYVAGDFNVLQDSLPAFSILHAAGFKDLQDIANERWGTSVVPTCKHATRKDFLYVSPELQELLTEVVIRHDVWPDHSVLQGYFRMPSFASKSWVWPVPKPFPWPQEFGSDVCWRNELLPTQAYQQLWHDIETQATLVCPFPVGNAMKGRAHRLRPKQLRTSQNGPVKLGRDGDFQPQFCGVSVKHAQWVRQVRRLQTFCRLMTSSADVVIQVAESWGSILRAKGFEPDFAGWWEINECKTSGAPTQCPIAPPPLHVATAMFDSLAKATRCLESDLMKYSRQYAKYRREQNPNLIFSDIKPSAAPGVDILLQPIRAKVVEIDEEEGKLVLDKPCAFAEETQILCDGIPLDIIHHEADAVWVHDFDRVKVGMPLSQTQCIGTPQALADLFVSAWKERWMRHADVPIERWNAILAFAKTHIPPGRFQWDPISPAQLAQVIRSKKSRTSAGFDGVTLRDLKSMPPAVLRAFCDMYAVAESTGAWPSQLVDGRVVSLAKVASPSGPSDFQPITIFGLLYRCWSSFHARQALTRLDEVLPATLYGSRPGRHATQIWSRLLWTIEDSFAMDVPLTGAVADLTKAFNFLPRVVVMELAAHMGIPAYVLLSWTGALTSMRRRFQLRDSLSSGVASVTGVPEGCGLSCVAMVLVDVCFHTWMRVYFPLCMPVSFVDDWQLLTCHPTLLQGAIDCMNRFVTAMDLHLDDRKAYAWSISIHFY